MLSIVTITFNNFSELKETLQSIQGIQDIESVVINGGNDVETRNFLSSYSGKSLNEKDDGISDAFNKGIAQSSGTAIAFLNSGDQLIDREFYTWANRVFAEDPSISFVYSDIVFNDPIAGKSVMKPRGKDNINFGAGMPFPHPSMIVRREVFAQVGGFSREFKIAMDFDFVVRMVSAGLHGVYYPQATVMMDGSGVSSTRELKGIEECKKSLLLHGQFNTQNQIGFRKRVLSYRARSILKRFLGDRAVRAAKLLKSKLK